MDPSPVHFLLQNDATSVPSSSASLTTVTGNNQRALENVTAKHSLTGRLLLQIDGETAVFDEVHPILLSSGSMMMN